MAAAAESVSPARRRLEEAARYYADPVGWVLWAYAWGEGDLAGQMPDAWQLQVLGDIAEGLRTNQDTGASRIAVASGHGIGKTALASWIIQWFISTRPTPQIVVTSGRKEQLLHKTWRELAVWHRRSIISPDFEWTATRYNRVGWRDTWFAAAVPWSIHNPDAFQGTHEKHVLMLFDEGSAIEDPIWEVSEGAMTTPGAVWVVFGNPTRNSGRFYQCFGQFRHRWVTRQVDSRTARLPNKAQIAEWVEDYGEDSDFVRVRVRGVFPRAGLMQLISSEDVELASQRKPDGWDGLPRIMGVDVARYGDSKTVIAMRQGPKLHPLHKFRGLAVDEVADRVAWHIGDWRPDACFIDATGLGAGVYDTLVRWGHRDVVSAVYVGARARKDSAYYNLRAEVWVAMRDWIRETGCLPSDQELRDALTSPEYGVDAKQRLQLERKEDMRERGLASPDEADALAMTFTRPVAPRSERKVETMPGPLRGSDGSVLPGGWMG